MLTKSLLKYNKNSKKKLAIFMQLEYNIKEENEKRTKKEEE